MTGVRAGEAAYIRDDHGTAVLSYRSFASVIPIVAALMSMIVVFAGVAGAAFLLIERRPVAGVAALLLSAAFGTMIIMLIPPTNFTIFEGVAPTITVAQKSSVNLPNVTYVVASHDGKPVGRIANSFFSRFGRNRWRLIAAEPSAGAGEAVEESLMQALVRKALGKFAPAYQSNVRITWKGEEAGWIIRRPGADGQADLLTLSPTTMIDRRIAVALATLVLGSEP